MKQRKTINIIGAGVLFVIIAGFLFFGNARSASALDCSPYPVTAIGACNYDTGHPDGYVTCQQCNDICGGDKNCVGMNRPCDKCDWIKFKDGTSSILGVRPSSDIETKVQKNPDVCDANSSISGVFKCLLLGVFGLVKLLLEMAATIFRWVIDVKNFNYVVDNKDIIYPIWQIVRDFLNIAFILVLLYSAFCTILQIEKYNYKKLLLKLIIMALLVNFSFPITRFIIDISNVLMYTLVKNLLGADAGNSMGFIAGQSGILPTLTASTSTFLTIITAIIFGFILAITLLAIGILLVIRIVALAILIIFSPLAFVATILPDASSYSSKWWDNLFKYSFFGPIMIFVIFIATHILKNMKETQNTLTQLAGMESIDPNIAGSLAYFAIPIVLLWMGMGIAQSISIAGAGAVMGGAQKFIKGAGKKFSGFNALKQQYTDYKKERDARKEEARFKLGKGLGEKANNLQDSIIGTEKAQKRINKRKTDKNKKDIDEGAKDLTDKGATTDTLAQQMNTHFSAPPPTDPKGKIDQAKSATAYLRQDSDERKMHIQNTITANGGVNGSDLEHIVNAAPPTSMAVGSSAYNSYMNAQNEARLAAIAIASGSTSENDIRKVAAFVNSQMKRRVDSGANA